MGTKLRICLPVRISPVAVFLAFAVFWQPLSKAQTSGGLDLQATQEPALGRLEISLSERQSLLVYVPSGTRAYLIGDPKGTSLAVVAWYSAEKKRLIAAIELRLVRDAVRQLEGVGVNAGVSREGSAPALLSITTAKSTPALLQPPGQVTVQAAGDAKSYALAPLLSVGGSTQLVSLAPVMASQALQAKEFSVQVYDRTGRKVAFKGKFHSLGGDLPIKVEIHTTKPNVPTPVVVTNPADSDKRVSLRPLPPVSWADTRGNEVRTVWVAAGGSVSPGDARSPTPGTQMMAYEEHRVPTLGHQPLTKGPVAAGPDGTVLVEARSPEPLAGALIEGRNATVSLTQGSLAGPAVAGRTPALFPFTAKIAGITAGAATVAFTLRNKKHEETVTIVPVSQSDLEQQSPEVQITAISTPGLLLGEEAPTTPPQPVAQEEPPRPCCVILGIEIKVGGTTEGSEETEKWFDKLKDILKEVGGKPAEEIGEKGAGIILGYKILAALTRPLDIYATLGKGLCKGEECPVKEKVECRLIPRDKNGQKKGMPGGVGGSENEAWPPRIKSQEDWWKEVGNDALARALANILKYCECDDGSATWPPTDKKPVPGCKK